MYETGVPAVKTARQLLQRARYACPPWAGHPLHAIDRNRYLSLKHFLTKRHRSYQGVMAFKDIDRFISSAGEVELDWSSLLQACEKTLKGDEHLWMSDYWTDPARKEGLSFVAIDQSVVIARGLYKTVLARYALYFKGADTLYGVKVSRWSVDWEMYHTWNALNDICARRFPDYHLIPEKKLLSRTPSGLWTVDEYLLALRRVERSTGREKVMSATEARGWLEDLGGKPLTPSLSALEHPKASSLAA